MLFRDVFSNMHHELLPNKTGKTHFYHFKSCVFCPPKSKFTLESEAENDMIGFAVGHDC